jgi:Uma2 family endonuclease
MATECIIHLMEQRVEKSRRYTLEEYNELETNSDQRYEYYGGEVIAMAGGSPAHALIILNVGGEMRARLKGTACRAYSNELRIRIPGTPLHLYPDASVICGSLELDPNETPARTALNPRLLVEVLSPSTERRDKGEKFRRYLQIDSLEEYVLVYQDRPRVESYYRQNGGTWLFSAAAGIDASADLRSLKIQLPLGEIYAGVSFPPVADSLEAPEDDL